MENPYVQSDSKQDATCILASLADPGLTSAPLFPRLRMTIPGSKFQVFFHPVVSSLRSK